MGLDPLPVPPHVFSLEPDRLAYACLPRQPGGFELQTYRSVELPPELFQRGLLGGPLREPKAFDDALAALVGSLEGPPKEASLAIPDAWMRVTFTAAGDLPARGTARDEILRWKLKRLVPFRVDELRIGAVEVEPLPRQPELGSEPRRLLLGFALEALLTQLESAFERAGVHLGQITNASLSLLGAVSAEAGRDLRALVLAEEDGYTLVFSRGREPVLHRHKGSTGAIAASARASFVERDLKLTRNFLEEQFPNEQVGQVLLAAPPELEAMWLELLGESLGGAVEVLSPAHLPLLPVTLEESDGSAPTWPEVALMLGVASQEVA